MRKLLAKREKRQKCEKTGKGKEMQMSNSKGKRDETLNVKH